MHAYFVNLRYSHWCVRFVFELGRLETAVAAQAAAFARLEVALLRGRE